MPDAEKLAAVEAILSELVALRRHLKNEGQEGSLHDANAFAMQKVAELLASR